MNEYVKKAKMLDVWAQDIPDVDIGDEVYLADVWNGEGEEPEKDYAYILSDDMDTWVVYYFDTISVCNDSLKNIVKITGIEII